MAKVIYIAGLGHSGSTILDMALGTLHNVIGLGELKSLLGKEDRERHYKSICSCGKKAPDCKVWGSLNNILDIEADDISKIEKVIKFLSEQYTRDVVIVDSSKNSYKYLKELNVRHNLSVVFLTRDVRSWSYSRFKNTGKPLIYYVLRWLIENWKLRSQLAGMEIKYLSVGYEELALYPEHILKIITDYTDLPFSDAVLNPGNTKSHIISGNVARADLLKKAGWYYDSRWLSSVRIMLWSPIISLFMSLNKKYVYPNVTNNSLKEHFIFGSKRRTEVSKKMN